MDWTALSQNLPAVIFALIFLIFFGVVAFQAINKRDQRMVEIFSELLQNANETNNEQNKNFLSGLSNFVEPLQKIAERLEGFMDTLNRIEGKVDRIESRQVDRGGSTKSTRGSVFNQ